MKEIINLSTEFLKLIGIIASRSKAIDQIKSVVGIYDQINIILQEVTSAHKFFIFATHNGGGKLKVNTPIYTTCLYGNVKDPLVDDKKDWKAVPLDEQYFRMICDLHSRKEVKIKVSDLEKGMLKDIYIKDDIKYVESRHLGDYKDKYIYYCVICSVNDIDGFTNEKDTAVINSSIRNITNLMNNKKQLI